VGLWVLRLAAFWGFGEGIVAGLVFCGVGGGYGGFFWFFLLFLLVGVGGWPFLDLLVVY
jgi:hypothetical protein